MKFPIWILFVLMFFAHSVYSSVDGDDQLGTFRAMESPENCIDHAGGFWFNGFRLLCWGDPRDTVDSILKLNNFYRTNRFQATYNGVEYTQGMMYHMYVENIFTHYTDKGGLDAVVVVFNDWRYDNNYINNNRTYNYLVNIFDVGFDEPISNPLAIHENDDDSSDIFSGLLQDAHKTYETPKNKIFDREYSSCDGDCGNGIYNGKEMDLESIAFMTGRAHQNTDYVSKNCKVRISLSKVGVLYYNKETGQTMNMSFDHPTVNVAFLPPKATLMPNMIH